MAGLTSAYKNSIGVRPVLHTTVLATAMAATATTMKLVSGTGVTTSTSFVILDGANTQFGAVHNISTNTVTITTATKKALTHPAGAYVFFMPTSGFGPIDFVPMDTFKVPDEYGQIYDTSRVGSVVVQRGVVQGMRESEWSFEGKVFPDTFGFILGSIFGTEKYTAGSTPTPHSHAFSVLNSGNGQPVKHAWFVYDGVNWRVVVGKITKVGIKLAGGKTEALTYSSTFMARASGVLTGASITPSFSTIAMLASWRAAFSIATSYKREVLSFTITLTREEAENIPTMTGTQDPLDTFYGGLQATAKGTFQKTGDTQLAAYIAGTVQKFSIVLAPLTGSTASTGTGLAFQATKANYDKVEPILQGKAYNTEDFALTFLANTSDAGTSGGISPCKATLKNAVATGVYL